MPNLLFSRYTQGENRVTASILAVFERISFALVERILQILSEETNLSLLEIKNQIKSGKQGSVPDGAIQASFTYLIETKVVQNSLHKDQLTAHLNYLNSLDNIAFKRLLVLTPDYQEPDVIKQLNSDLVVWASFNDLYSAIAEITTTSENRYGVKFKVFFLSAPDSPETIQLSHDIRNDLRSRTGKPTAFTQGQRYVPLSGLKKNPATTTELLSSQGV